MDISHPYIQNQVLYKAHKFDVLPKSRFMYTVQVLHVWKNVFHISNMSSIFVRFSAFA